MQGFVKDKGWQEPKVFFDDDRTGTNFDRKGWQDLYAEVQKGTINVIVIKDTSRFGRNWVQSGDYFNRIDEMGVRFISIQENLDTIDPKCPALKMLPFYFIFNEWHSQTTSEKIRTVFSKQYEQGKYLAAYAPYGYDKDPNDKYKLIVDPYAANIVKRIFEMRLQKHSYGVIARVLNDEGILSPSGYQAEKRNIKNKQTRVSKWSTNSVIMLINNPVFCGDVVHSQVGCASYKNQKQVSKPVEEWIIAKDMHEPIISRENWQKCQELRKEAKRIRSTANGDTAPFTGLLKCSDCGYTLVRTSAYYTLSSGERKSNVGYNCGTYARKGQTACTSHYILERDLKELVIADIREKAGEVTQDENAARERFYTIKAQSSGTKLDADRNALKKVNKRLAELEKLIKVAFEKSVLGSETSEIFSELEREYKADKQELSKRAKQLSASIEKQSQTENDVETFIALMKKYVNISELYRETAVELIDHITVSASAVKPREIEIFYNLMGNVE